MQCNQPPESRHAACLRHKRPLPEAAATRSHSPHAGLLASGNDSYVSGGACRLSGSLEASSIEQCHCISLRRREEVKGRARQGKGGKRLQR